MPWSPTTIALSRTLSHRSAIRTILRSRERQQIHERFGRTAESAFRNLYSNLDFDPWFSRSNVGATTRVAIETWRRAAIPPNRTRSPGVSHRLLLGVRRNDYLRLAEPIGRWR